MRIKSFHREWRFLSNFYNAPTIFEGILYPTSEHAYQAAKVKDRKLRFQIKRCLTTGRAKRMGAKMLVRSDWEEARLQVMYEVVRSKFILNPGIRKQLLATGHLELIENNNWHDNFWGSCLCSRCCNVKGDNHLGQILMRVREELRDGG